MAIQKNNVVMYGTSGKIGKMLVFKNYSGKMVVSRAPDMSKVVYNQAQQAEQFRFKLAVAFARGIISDPVKKAQYPKGKHLHVYHAAIADYLNSSIAEAAKPTSNSFGERKRSTQPAINGLPAVTPLVASSPSESVPNSRSHHFPPS